MNWNKINLESSYEREQNILDAYNSETLLLEIKCNVLDITEDTVRKQFEESLKNNLTSAREVFEANLTNIVKKAQKDRNTK